MHRCADRVVNTSPHRRQRGPAASRSSSWRVRCRRSAPTATPGIVIVRRLRSVFGSPSRCSAPARSSVRRTDNSPASRSTSSHRSPRASPAATPVQRDREILDIGMVRDGLQERGRLRGVRGWIRRARGSPPPADRDAVPPVCPYPTQCLQAILDRLLGDLDPRAVCIDRKVLRGHCMVIALGIDAEGRKHVIDGAPGLHQAITAVFGSRGVVPRCQGAQAPERARPSPGAAARVDRQGAARPLGPRLGGPPGAGAGAGCRSRCNASTPAPGERRGAETAGSTGRLPVSC